MLMTVLIVLILAMGAYSGARRGLVLQFVFTIGYFVSYLLARNYYQLLGSHLELIVPYPSATESSQFVFYDQALGFNLDGAFYNGVAFITILFVGWLITRFVGGLLNAVTLIPVIKQLNTLGGALLNVIVSYIAIFIVLFLLTMVPVDAIQESFNNSWLARTIVEDTPVISAQLYNWWIESSLK
ncbi:Uncharacterized membrane protein, required for colicin V production [Carnobacterium viridans]|uniref:Uncharacterized membrane protein, required for colicin V production n=2 Tax=Carnobacterium viridans TaxID=174587 RepID=A0A1H1B570_9LACT|nr:Uncharacterized membrane protein, required for colicin V production [Carnobacterium viridans]